jgi:hypothetical protein
VATGTPGNGSNGSDSENEDENESSDLAHKKVHISKNDMRELLDSCGKDMHKKLGEILKGKTKGTVWHNRDFRIDAGQPMKGNPKIRTWNLQVNKDAESKVAKKYKGLKRGTDERLFWGKFNVENPPTYKEWKDAILASFK